MGRRGARTVATSDAASGDVWARTEEVASWREFSDKVARFKSRPTLDLRSKCERNTAPLHPAQQASTGV